MNKIVLAYNFNSERLQQLRQVCMILKVNCSGITALQFTFKIMQTGRSCCNRSELKL